MEQQTTNTVKNNARVSVQKLQSKTLKNGKVEDVNQYYIIIDTPKGQHTINTGEKAYNRVLELTEPRETSTQIQVFPPENKNNDKQ